jgi:predicted RND superfamily exporter protein
VKRFRQTIETRFAELGSWAFRRRLTALAIALLLCASTTVPLGSLRTENSMESLFHSRNPARLALEEFRERFGNDDLLIILLEPPDLFDSGFLERLKQIHRELEETLPYLADIHSLVNARLTRGEEERLIVGELLERVPETPEEMAAFRTIVLTNPLYRNSLVSADGRCTAIGIEPDLYHLPDPLGEGEPLRLETAQYAQMLERVETILEPHREAGIGVAIAGQPVVTVVLFDAMQTDVRTITPLTLLLVVVFLALLFRRLSGVIYPLIVVCAALLSSVGTMAALGIPLTNITGILPTFVLVVGVADSVHVLTLFYQRHRGTPDAAQAMRHAFGHAGPPVLLTSLTTAAGLLSFSTADVAWVAHLGICAPIGVLYALIYTVLLIPALVALLGVRRLAPVSAGGTPPVDRVLVFVGDLAVARPRAVILIWVLLLLAAAYGFVGLRLSQNGMLWLPEHHPLRVDTAKIDAEMGGTLTIEVIIDTGEESGLYDAELMKKLDSSAAELEGYRRGPIRIGKAATVTTVLKEVNRALRGNDPAAYRLPDTDQLVAQELLLFEMSGSDDLERIVSTDLRAVRMTLSTPFEDGMFYTEVIDEIETRLREEYSSAEVALTGITTLFTQAVENILTSMARSYPVALIVVTLLMVLLLGRLEIGLLSMAPNLVPVLIVTGLMGWLRIPFDFATMTVGSIAIGLVVDDTIHFLHAFNRELERGADVRAATRQTLLTTGRAMFVTSLTLIAGFLAYTQATLQNLIDFGVLIAAVIALALLADFTLVPALLSIRKGVSARGAPLAQSE